ncbi:ABC transporter ATP-binding protein [Vitreoscilla filiformis]|jgi:sodium transport system ATP-binding protein|uniref:ABC transporter ATP-binding protein n=1 Tax=Vitreoscilla filiformis TaxID=63 RepID=A0A221K9X8_VITFI|nr:ATP-binding cassette domain-containing protein [Vitreoscilla filiformis]ASM75821.1 ABC transporter ATP-binding protein [Vitreoscilla filiformis]
MIEVEHLACRFAAGWRQPAVVAVRHVSWCAPDGCITALLGPNGAGKTTTLRMVAGLLSPDNGSIRIDGLDGLREPRAVRARLGWLSDERGLYTRLTARENILYHARLHGLAEAQARQRTEQLAQWLELEAVLDRPTAGFSQGERMKTALARALIHDPPNIVLDEPTNGLDVLATRALRRILRRLRDEAGKCIVLSTHIMQEVERLSDQVVIVAQGRTVAQGTVNALRAATAQTDFESAFVHLAFGADHVGDGP